MQQHPYTPPTSSTQLSNQAQAQPQYSVTNSQQLTQSPQTSHQSSVMIIYSFRFQNISNSLAGSATWTINSIFTFK